MLVKKNEHEQFRELITMMSAFIYGGGTVHGVFKIKIWLYIQLVSQLASFIWDQDIIFFCNFYYSWSLDKINTLYCILFRNFKEKTRVLEY